MSKNSKENIYFNENNIEDMIGDKIGTTLSPLSNENGEIESYELLGVFNQNKYNFIYQSKNKETGELEDIQIKTKYQLFEILGEIGKEDVFTKNHIDTANLLYKNNPNNNMIYSVNLSKNELEDPYFLKHLIEVYKKDKDFFKQLKFEILEDINIDFENEVTKNLIYFVENVGASMALDDIEISMLNIKRIEKLHELLKTTREIDINNFNITEDGKLNIKYLNENIIDKSSTMSIKADGDLTEAYFLKSFYNIIKPKFEIGAISEKEYNNHLFNLNIIKDKIKDNIKRNNPNIKIEELELQMNINLSKKIHDSKIVIDKFEKSLDGIGHENIKKLIFEYGLNNNYIDAVKMSLSEKMIDKLLIQGDKVVHYNNNPFYFNEDKSKLHNFIKKVEDIEDQNKLNTDFRIKLYQISKITKLEDIEILSNNVLTNNDKIEVKENFFKNFLEDTNRISELLNFDKTVLLNKTILKHEFKKINEIDNNVEKIEKLFNFSNKIDNLLNKDKYNNFYKESIPKIKKNIEKEINLEFEKITKIESKYDRADGIAKFEEVIKSLDEKKDKNPLIENLKEKINIYIESESVTFKMKYKEIKLSLFETQKSKDQQTEIEITPKDKVSLPSLRL